MSYIFFLLSLVSLLALILGLIKPGIFSRLIKNPSRKKLSLIFILATIVFIILIGVTAEPSKKHVESKVANSEPTSETTEIATITTSTPLATLSSDNKIPYEIIWHQNNNTVENYKILIKSGDDGKAAALDVEKSCKNPCIIDVFDNKQALELQNEYDEMMGKSETKPEDLESWKQKNYIFVADHFVGYINLELPGKYSEYPYKDWYYKELKGT